MPSITLDLSATHGEILRYRPNQEQPDCGGGMLMMGVTWGEETPRAINVEVSALVLVATEPGVYEPLLDDNGNPVRLYGGAPGQGERLGVFSRDPSRPDYCTLVRGYLRRLKPGVYYVRVQSRAQGDPWPSVETGSDAPEPFAVLPRVRYHEIYDVRKKWPEASTVGPRALEQDRLVPIVETYLAPIVET